MIKGQLWKKTDSGCELVNYATDKGAVLATASNVPVMFWPDGEVCWPVTMWLVQNSQYYIDSWSNKGPRNKRGGTPVTKASLISFLVRFTFESRKKNFTLLTDDDIKRWAKDLAKERNRNDGLSRRRENTQVGRIIRKGLSFLLWYQHFMLPHDRLIGTDVGCQITIQDRIDTKTCKNGKEYSYRYTNHRHIPGGSTPQDVKPVGHHNITRLYNALREVARNPQARKRDENILRLLEATGGRRVEIADLTVKGMMSAYKCGKLQLKTAKSDVSNPREIPISKEWLEPVVGYINTYRKKLVKELIDKGKIDSDPVALFINTTNGEKLSEEWITKLISKLRRAAQINEKICAHMFRHRFITIQVAERLKDYEQKDLPLDVAHTILTKVSALSGHSDPRSMENYIDLAFDELGIWDTSERVLLMRSKLEGAYRQIQTFRNDLTDNNLSCRELFDRVDALLGSLLSSVEQKSS